MNTKKGKQKNALILGCSSGFGGATAIRLAKDGYRIFGVHLDRKQTLYRVEEIKNEIKNQGKAPVFFNMNAAAADKRKEVVKKIRTKIQEGEYITVFLHSLAFG
ncbi:MAG: SDR family NAD(P)-dependent oxidoreductase, partial [Calditrichia bacterium]|nr:SDR family NAD(P)-dependent oxidoreductase [Calditrichia bacterium]